MNRNLRVVTTYASARERIPAPHEAQRFGPPDPKHFNLAVEAAAPGDNRAGVTQSRRFVR